MPMPSMNNARVRVCVDGLRCLADPTASTSPLRPRTCPPPACRVPARTNGRPLETAAPNALICLPERPEQVPLAASQIGGSVRLLWFVHLAVVTVCAGSVGLWPATVRPGAWSANRRKAPSTGLAADPAGKRAGLASVMPVTLLLPAVKLLRLPVRLLAPRWTGWLIGVPVMCHAPQAVPSADRRQKHFPPAARRPRWAPAAGCRPWSQAAVTPDDRGCRPSRRRRGLGCGGTAAPGPLDGPDRPGRDSARPARDRAPP